MGVGHRNRHVVADYRDADLHDRLGYAGCAVIPVPTAVPPIASSARAARQDETRRIPWSIWDWYPENSWPRRIGVASIKWVRPDFTIGSNSFAFFARLSSSSRRAASRFWSISMSAATWIAVGITSFEDWPMFTWSFGWTGPFSLSA